MKRRNSPLLDLYPAGTVCELTDAGRHFSPDDLNRRFVVSGVTHDGMIACTSIGWELPFTLPPRVLKPISTPVAPRSSPANKAAPKREPG
jgi:hypothetical protein